MAFVRFQRVLPDKTETEVAVNADWVLWAQPIDSQTVLLKTSDGPDVVVRGKLDAVEEKLNT